MFRYTHPLARALLLSICAISTHEMFRVGVGAGTGPLGWVAEDAGSIGGWRQGRALAPSPRKSGFKKELNRPFLVKIRAFVTKCLGSALGAGTDPLGWVAENAGSIGGWRQGRALAPSQRKSGFKKELKRPFLVKIRAFVTKLSGDGSRILWSTYYGGSKASSDQY